MKTASTAYIVASINRHHTAADSSSESLIAFGSSRLIALWDTADKYDRGVKETLPGHEGLVTCVQFMREDRLASADDKGVLRFWDRVDNEWKSSSIVQAHSKAISSLYYYNGILATGASDSTVKIWAVALEEAAEKCREIQSIDLRGIYPLCLRLATLPGSNAATLAIGGTDKSIHIWTRSDEIFVRSAVLSGHEDWVRSLDFKPPQSNQVALVLASGSQDGIIRLWNIEPFVSEATKLSLPAGDALSDELLDAFEAALGNIVEGEEGGRQISLKRHVITVKDSEENSQRFSITFDALLIGHEAGITSLSWRPSAGEESVPTLLSTSTDSSVILWSPSTIIASSTDESTSLWINRHRFGDVGGQRLGGFVGGLWAREGMETLAWGWSGGWRRWQCTDAAQTSNEVWSEIGAIGGHNGPVRSISWSPKGEYLISASVDQTTRIHGPIPMSSDNCASLNSWHELARPQVHGYDLVGVAFLDGLRFVSVADEKVARVFEAPRSFVEVITSLKVADLAVNEVERPAAASVPPLGLSNKAITDSSLPVQHGSTLSDRRPFEGELAAITLWPETEKIFGHGYESITLAISNDKKLVATACKATSPEHAVVRVYDTDKWQPVGKPLQGHSLTVTRISFSPDDRYILTVSRDRSWRLFEAKDGSGYVPAGADKSHGRIIWDCSWAPEGDAFATASRDKTVRVWSRKTDSGQWATVGTLKLKEAATAVAFDAASSPDRRRLAVAVETGEIITYTCARDSLTEWKKELALDRRLAHIDHIYQLAWRPGVNQGHKQIATCSEDGTLKILDVHV